MSGLFENNTWVDSDILGKVQDSWVRIEVYYGKELLLFEDMAVDNGDHDHCIYQNGRN